ncbi:MAG: ParB/RepB/Spo0J family partition protein [Candidatus Kapabacteria bacterium]|nr:ParB/RepB/Spo0J family partition protein [Candidatus Kapabacteria bacterium]
MKQGQGLGKGIGALIPKELLRPDSTAQQLLAGTTDEVLGVAQVGIERISTNPVQPRHHFDEGALEELAQSIAVHGVITPITVRPHFDGYELISGERRLRASKMAGLTTIPAYVINVGSDGQMLEIALVENLQREDLNPLEVAIAYQRLIEECNLKQEDVAIKVGKDRSTVANFLRLLKLPPDAQSALRTRRITMGHARALLALSSDMTQLVVLREIIKRELSVRKTEALVKDLELGRKELVKGGEIKSTSIGASRSSPRPDSSTSVSDIENSLRHLFATQVRVRMKNDESGSVDIEFYSLEELERLLEMMLSMNGQGNS